MLRAKSGRMLSLRPGGYVGVRSCGQGGTRLKRIPVFQADASCVSRRGGASRNQRDRAQKTAVYEDLVAETKGL